MVLELFGQVVVDGVGAKAKANRDKKNLEEAKGDPEEYERLVEQIEKRKQQGNKIALFLFFLLIVLAIARN
jgi:hypothetical protein